MLKVTYVKVFAVAITSLFLVECSPKHDNINWNKCVEETSKHYTALYDYSDFGPPSMSTEFLGTEYWQWDSFGGGNPKTTFDVKVVVYADYSKKLAMIKYIVNPETLEDYRYVSYGEAMSYLDANILELEEIAKIEGEVSFPELTAKLKNTQSRIETEICQND